MNRLFSVSYLEVGYSGNLLIRIPITTLGEGNPQLAIMCGVHGDEIAGLVIARYFACELMKRGELRGSVSFITVANPLAQITRTRVATSDYSDLNRAGLGKVNGNFTDRLAYALCGFLARCSFFVDLHDFIMMTPNMALYFPSSQKTIEQQIIQGIAAFNPPVVWAVKLSTQDEVKYSGSLTATLVDQGIPGFAVETSRLTELSSLDRLQVVEGLLEVAKLVGVIDEPCRISLPPAFLRQEIRSNQAGIWTPKATLLEYVKKDEIVGEITSLDFAEDVAVRAPIEGRLIQLASTNLVDTGTALFTVGIEDTEFAMKLRLLLGSIH